MDPFRDRNGWKKWCRKEWARWIKAHPTNLLNHSKCLTVLPCQPMVLVLSKDMQGIQTTPIGRGAAQVKRGPILCHSPDKYGPVHLHLAALQLMSKFKFIQVLIPCATVWMTLQKFMFKYFSHQCDSIKRNNIKDPLGYQGSTFIGRVGIILSPSLIFPLQSDDTQ